MDVVWRNGIWTYGNWGGKGWSGGKFTAPNEPVPRGIDGLDSLDRVFRLHDIAYENLQDDWDTSAKTEADCHRYYDALYQADTQMVVAIDALRSFGALGERTTSNGSYFAANQATVVFVAKIQRDKLLHAQACHPDDDHPNIPPVLFIPWVVPIVVQSQFAGGLAWTQPRDPLILDLDNDGIELTTSNSAILFDHNADGIKTGTQWAKGDDGILVRDLNGNGTIDSGRELFGDQTQISTVNALGQSVTTLAANGFAALTALDKDANGVADGIFNASDIAYKELKLWRDLNQDGISQSNELLGLAEYGVSAINLVQSAAQTAQGKSTFTQTVTTTDANGDPVTTSREQTVQNVNFTQNSFYREFADNPVVTAQAAALPQMQGAGVVRDLREAMSLGTAQAAALSPLPKLAKTCQTIPSTRLSSWHTAKTCQSPYKPRRAKTAV